MRGRNSFIWMYVHNVFSAVRRKQEADYAEAKELSFVTVALSKLSVLRQASQSLYYIFPGLLKDLDFSIDAFCFLSVKIITKMLSSKNQVVEWKCQLCEGGNVVCQGSPRLGLHRAPCCIVLQHLQTLPTLHTIYVQQFFCLIFFFIQVRPNVGRYYI